MQPNVTRETLCLHTLFPLSPSQLLSAALVNNQRFHHSTVLYCSSLMLSKAPSRVSNEVTKPGNNDPRAFASSLFNGLLGRSLVATLETWARLFNSSLRTTMLSRSSLIVLSNFSWSVLIYREKISSVLTTAFTLVNFTFSYHTFGSFSRHFDEHSTGTEPKFTRRIAFLFFIYDGSEIEFVMRNKGRKKSYSFTFGLLCSCYVWHPK